MTATATREDPGPMPDHCRGLAACRAELRQALLAWAEPATAAPSLMYCLDHHFGAWPFDEPAVQQALAAGLRGTGRRLVLVGVDFDATARQLPRFARWRRDHGHRIDIWCPADEGLPGGGLPDGLRGLLAGAVAWQWRQTPDAQLRRITDPVHRAAYRAEIADFLQRCVPTWPVSTLGL